MISTKQNLKNLIAKGKSEKAIDQLLELSPRLDKDLREEIFIQSARFKTYQREKRQGSSSKEELHVTLLQITHALIGIIEELPEEDLIISKTKKNVFKWAGSIAAFIAFLAAVSEFSGYSLKDICQRNGIREPSSDTSHIKDIDTAKEIHATSPPSPKDNRRGTNKEEGISKLRFEGKVKDDNNNYLDSVRISIGTTIVYTDSNGIFRIEVDSSAKGVQIRADKNGYSSDSKTFDISGEVSLILNKKNDD